MELIVISHPDFWEEEAVMITQLFDIGLGCLHVRKPTGSYAQVDQLIRCIPEKYRQRMVLHQHYALAFESGLSGIHIPEYHLESMSIGTWLPLLEKVQQHQMTLSSSVHTRKSLLAVPTSFDYVMFSPVFPSISKPDYRPTEDMNICGLYPGVGIVGLGGISLQNLEEANEMGYNGVAILGAVWGKGPMEDAQLVVSNFLALQQKIQAINKNEYNRLMQ